MNMPESRLSRGQYGIAVVVANKQKMKIKKEKKRQKGDLWWTSGEETDSEDELRTLIFQHLLLYVTLNDN